MPSIFIWKAEEPSNTKKQIRYYSGSNWMLEDNDFSSKSYMFLDQIVIPGFNDSVITYRAKAMPQDWVGSELLEVSYVPYEHIKADNYGTLDRIGNWMRFTTKSETDFDEESLKKELAHIQKWINQKHSNRPNRPIQNTIPDVQQQFQEFLIKYTIPQSTMNAAVSDTKPHIIGSHQTNDGNRSNNKNKYIKRYNNKKPSTNN